MNYQVFTRSYGKSPRRYCIALTIDEAQRICQQYNAKRTAKQRRAGTFREFANLPWYIEAFGR